MALGRCTMKTQINSIVASNSAIGLSNIFKIIAMPEQIRAIAPKYVQNSGNPIQFGIRTDTALVYYT